MLEEALQHGDLGPPRSGLVRVLEQGDSEDHLEAAGMVALSEHEVHDLQGLEEEVLLECRQLAKLVVEQALKDSVAQRCCWKLSIRLG